MCSSAIDLLLPSFNNILVPLIVYQNLYFLKVPKAFVWEKMIFA